jgi:hypothetical protein
VKDYVNMSNNDSIKYLPVNVAGVLTKGDTVGLLKYEGDRPLHLPGFELEKYSIVPPRKKLKHHINSLTSCNFGSEHFRYLGIVYHCEYGKEFLTSHYWLNLDNIQENYVVDGFDYDNYCNGDEWFWVPMSEAILDKHWLLEVDKLAIHRVIKTIQYENNITT